MLAGPLATARLGDLGADVIKLEPPLTGEFNRRHGFEDLRVGGEMTTFLAVNRSKRSLALDVKDPDALDALYAVVRTADVFVQNFRHGTAQRLGIGYEQLRKVNPRLVYCSISGYGSVGPYRDRPGQDLVLQGYSGSMWSVGKQGDPPVPGALWAADVMTGYQAAIGVLAALEARHRTGEGQHVEVDMFTVVLDSQLQELVTYLNAGAQPRRTQEASAHGSIPAPYGVYEANDGWLTLAMTELPRLGDVLEDDFLRGLTAYNDGHVHRDEVYRRIRGRFLERSTTDWIERCDRFGVWAGPVYDYDDLSKDAHVAEAGMFVDQPHYDGSTVRTLRVPIQLSGTPTRISRGAPRLGQDTREILAEVGFESAQIDALTSAGAARDDGSPRDAASARDAGSVRDAGSPADDTRSGDHA